MAVAVLQFTPSSKDTATDWPLVRLAFKVPLMVCELVLVMKSVLLLPASALNDTAVTVVVGGLASTL